MKDVSSTNRGEIKPLDKLEDKSKEELIEMVKELRKENQTLKKKEKSPKEKPSKKEFIFEKYNQRHIALKIAYFGWDYAGFAEQTHIGETVEVNSFFVLIEGESVRSVAEK